MEKKEIVHTIKIELEIKVTGDNPNIEVVANQKPVFASNQTEPVKSIEPMDQMEPIDQMDQIDQMEHPEQEITLPDEHKINIVGLHESTNQSLDKWFEEENDSNGCWNCKYADKGENSSPCKECIAARSMNGFKYIKWEIREEKENPLKKIQHVLTMF